MSYCWMPASDSCGRHAKNNGTRKGPFVFQGRRRLLVEQLYRQQLLFVQLTSVLAAAPTKPTELR
jgi:hypothetical protein